MKKFDKISDIAAPKIEKYLVKKSYEMKVNKKDNTLAK